MKLEFRNRWFALCTWLMLCMPFITAAQTPTKYTASDNAITGFNGKSYNNRPLYCNNTDAFILTGDRPLIRFVHTPFIFGSFMLAVRHNGKVKWLVDCSSIKMEYRGNMTTWTVSDTINNFPIIKLSVLPMEGSVGMVIQVTVQKARPGDELVWVYGGYQYKNEGSLSWNFDIAGNPKMKTWGFRAEEATGNKVIIKNGKFLLGPLTDTGKSISGAYGMVAVNADTSVMVEGICSDTSMMKVIEAAKIPGWQNANEKTNLSAPIVNGTIALTKAGREIYWLIKPFGTGKNDTTNISPKIAWQKGMLRIQALSRRIIVNTPDGKLNALASISSSVTDGVWYDSVYVHGAMLWNIPFPGWRTIFGGTMYGWHERVKKEAQYYIATQNKDTAKRYAKPDTALLSTIQDKSSRFYGLGHIDRDQFFYNFQSQFFDQLITEWRSSGDMELETLLFPALELHLKWEEECFDPDGDGVYESYINTWPTDSQWYNGGGTAEETSYAYKAHKAAAEMAIRKGDMVSAGNHQKKLQQIKNGFFSKLWIAGKGFSAAYREQGGYQRLHEDPWLYSIFLPIDATLVNKEQAITSLYYTRWALQNDRMPAGGRKVWTSNWVPGIPTVRELYNGDNYHLALAYFLSGMADDGWDIMKGTFYEGAFNGNVPGDLGVNNGGTDFNDCSSMFARVLVEGLFGYLPDYPNNKVTIAPQFPKEWKHASISTPDFSFKFIAEKNMIKASVHISKPATLDVYLPVNVTGIKKVIVNKKPVQWMLLAGYGKSGLQINLPEITDASIDIETTGALRADAPVSIEKSIGEAVQLKITGATITALHDPQKVFSTSKIVGETLFATISGNTGNHTVIADVLVGKAPRKRVFYLKISDKAAVTREQLKSVRSIPANTKWSYVDISKTFNADVRTIFKQQYLSPRPNTVSARIGTDGYSPWTFLFWKFSAPAIKLDSVQALLKDSNHIHTKQDVPFYWNASERNIAFTSLWDNWPKAITIPVNQQGKAVWLMIAGSTNPMQCHIANAHIVFNYDDNSSDTLLLIPPFNYWSLAPYNIKSPSPGVVSRGDYTNETDLFAVPKPWPPTVQLGENCRAILLNRVLKSGATLKNITLQTLSQEVVVGLMGITIMK